MYILFFLQHYKFNKKRIENAKNYKKRARLKNYKIIALLKS